MGRILSVKPDIVSSYGIEGVFGSGEYVEFVISRVFTIPANIKIIRVRVTGGGGVASNASANGANGGTSSFGTLISATGGGGGQRSTDTVEGLGGIGGIGIGGDTQFTGGNGGAGSVIHPHHAGKACAGGGGGAAGTIMGNGGYGRRGSIVPHSSLTSVVSVTVGARGVVPNISAVAPTKTLRFTGDKPYFRTGSTSIFNGFETIDISTNNYITTISNPENTSGTGRKSLTRGDGAAGGSFMYNEPKGSFASPSLGWGGGNGGAATNTHCGGGGGGGGFAMGVFEVRPLSAFSVICGSSGGFVVVEY